MDLYKKEKAEKAIAAVHGMLSLHATVLRENKRMIIPASELVVGDLVLLSGDKIPADLNWYVLKIEN
ncbi:hypothetical protein PGH45_18420 [Legionella pneumophila]|nr:hypothetical protein [Legionella pneumophila]